MNAELTRNLWLELTPRRLALMGILLALAFFAAGLSGGTYFSPVSVATNLYYFIVIIWGARNAALSVVGEIRDRTWDLQRLSSLGAGEMTWGKLFGATAYNWYGGAICLAVILVHGFTHDDPIAVISNFIYLLVAGVMAQAVALLASLAAVRRRQSHTRLELFVYQLAGIAAAIAVYWVWSAADPASSIIAHKAPTDFIPWWGHSYDARPFLLLSLAIFTAWTLLGCYREMRLELKMRNGPLVWLAFLVFIGIYVAGFDAWLSQDKIMASWDAVALRLALATTTFAVLTYAMVLLEPKDRVHYRWLGGELRAGRIAAALGGLQGWMMGYIATFIFSALLIWWLARTADMQALALIAAAMGFITRDVALFVFMHTLPGRRRGDFAVLLTLIALYILAPAILNGLDLKNALMFFFPRPSNPPLLGAAIAWAEGIGMAVLAIGRLAIGEKPKAPA